MLRAQGADSIITTVPVVTASGGKLPLFIIMKGKTPSCLSRLTEGIESPAHPLKKLIAYQIVSGFMNDDIMCTYIEQVMGPYVRQRFLAHTPNAEWPPQGDCAALIFDRHRSHLTRNVYHTAKQWHIEIIVIPSFPDSTSLLQPLDVGVNGVLKSKRKKVFMQSLQALKNTTDRVITVQETVLSQVNAYASLNSNIILDAFRKSGLIN